MFMLTMTILSVRLDVQVYLLQHHIVNHFSKCYGTAADFRRGDVAVAWCSSSQCTNIDCCKLRLGSAATARLRATAAACIWLVSFCLLLGDFFVKRSLLAHWSCWSSVSWRSRLMHAAECNVLVMPLLHSLKDSISYRFCAGFIVVFILDICSKISATEAFFFCWNVSSWIQLVRRASHFSRSSSTFANMLWIKKVRKKSCALGSENEQRGIGLGEFSST